MRILIADDDGDIRKLLTRMLEGWGHEVVTARDGAEAWELLQKEPISFVISDWMMPQMDGLQLCKRIRAAQFPRYIYIILLTAKDAKRELVEGMQAGADDFVVKPFNKGELRVRIRAGERILRLERDLEERNRKLSQAYETIRKDLEAAAKMQKDLLPPKATVLSGIKFYWIFLPSTFVAGDIFNFFELDQRYVGFYILDVAGHGIPAAMLSVTLSKMLSPAATHDSLLQRYLPKSSQRKITPPADVIKNLNQKFQSETDAMQYFTMIYGIIDTQKGKLRFSQAGHPSPVLIRRGRDPQLIGDGGFPVGMVPDMEYEEQEVDFNPGDRLVLYSDGITECTNENNQQFTAQRFLNYLVEHRDLCLEKMMDSFTEVLRGWSGRREFDDDVTAFAIEASSLSRA